MQRLPIHTFEHVISLDNLLLAWREFVLDKRYKPDVARYSLGLFDNVWSLHSSLVDGTYRHGSYYRFVINDPKKRVIHKASVQDRLVHHALYRVLYPFFERTFCSDVFSARVDKGTHAALRRFGRLARRISRNNTRTCWVLKCDIRRFFDSVDHAILKRLIRQRVADPKLRALIGLVIDSFCSSPGKGLPLGNLTSQVFCNIYMSAFDDFIKHTLRPPGYIRYADDFVLLSPNKLQLRDALTKISRFLRQRLALSLHPQKISIGTLASGVDFLGWVHFAHHRVLRAKTRQRLIRRSVHSPTPQTIASYRGLVSHGHARQIEQQLKSIELFGSY